MAHCRVSVQLDEIQKHALFAITSAIAMAPIKALDVLLILMLLDILIQILEMHTGSI